MHGSTALEVIDRNREEETKDEAGVSRSLEAGVCCCDTKRDRKAERVEGAQHSRSERQ